MSPVIPIPLVFLPLIVRAAITFKSLIAYLTKISLHWYSNDGADVASSSLFLFKRQEFGIWWGGPK